MKFLHINNFDYPDYLNDMTYHGGFSLFGVDYETNKDPSYMFSNHEDRRPEINLKNCHGKGFTIYKKLKPSNTIVNSDKELIYKIKNKYFDYIIFGSAWRHLDHYDLIIQNYQKNKIIFIDGEDHCEINGKCLNGGLYFKRELTHNINNVFPISFSIPINLIDFEKQIKDKEFSYIDPRDKSTYIYNNENDYYKDYKTSYFGITMRKAGWDCLRHYEIIMNRCVPIFLHLDQCPPSTMTHFPKKLLNDFYSSMKNRVIDFQKYEDTINSLQNHVHQYCSTESMFLYILDVTKRYTI